MKHIIQKMRVTFFLFLITIAFDPKVHGLEISDATQTQVNLANHPERIVTLAPSLGELVADLLGDEIHKIIGVSEFSNYPPALKKVPSIGPYFKFNLEKIITLKPDLVLATKDGNSKDQVLRLRELKIPVFVVTTSTLNDIENSMRLVGIALGLKEKGQKMAQQLHLGFEKIRAKAHSRSQNSKPRVLLQVGDDPLVVAGKFSFLNELVQLLGAANVYGELHAEYPRPSAEDAIHRNPDALIIFDLENNSVKTQQAVQKWLRFSNLSAVQKKQIRVIEGDSVLRPTLRLLEGLTLLKKAIYGKI